MKTYSSKILLIANLVLLFASLMHAQRHSTRQPSLPSDVPINVRINENLSSETAQTGDEFTGVLTQPLVASGSTVFPKGSTVTGQVTAAQKSGRLSNPGVLELTVMSINNHPVSSQPFIIKGASHTKSNVVKIGGGTAAGAIIGGIAGGGKGAAIGAGVGAGAGTATAAVTGKKPASVESEAVLQFLSSGGPPQAAGDSRSIDHRSEQFRSRRNNNREDDEADDDDRDDRQNGSRNHDGYSFSQSDRNVLNGCLSGYDFESLPPGIQKKLARGGTLSPGQAKKLRALPDACNARLPRLPRDLERIILGDRVLILQDGNRILDMLTFER
jgi:hypothetical protein